MIVAAAVYALMLGLTSTMAFKSMTVMHDFDTYISRYGREYEVGSAEYLERKAVFDQNVAAVNRQNSKSAKLWTARVNHLADRTKHEVDSLMGWRHLGGHTRRPGNKAAASLLEVFEAPSSIDWRNLSMAFNVKDQKECGSCWAVTTAAVLEAHYEIVNQKPRTFSAQELVSCVQNPRSCGGDGGCKGATVELGMDWAMHRGLKTEEEKMYQGIDSQCDKDIFREKESEMGELDADGRILMLPKPTGDSILFNSGSKYIGDGFGLKGFTTLPTNKLQPLLRAVVEHGPVAVSVAADEWILYDAGVFDDCSKDATLNHAVTLFGYGTLASQDYWLVRNSWGSEWGEKGFIKLKRHSDEESYCGKDTDPTQGLSCKGAPSSITVCGSCGILYDSVIPNMDFHGTPAARDVGVDATDSASSVGVSGEVVLEKEASVRYHNRRDAVEAALSNLRRER